MGAGIDLNAAVDVGVSVSKGAGIELDKAMNIGAGVSGSVGVVVNVDMSASEMSFPEVGSDIQEWRRAARSRDPSLITWKLHLTFSQVGQLFTLND